MSVRKYSMEEIGRLFADSRRLVSGWPISGVKEDRLGQALRAAYYANRAALACTYNRQVTIRPFQAETGISRRASPKAVFTEIGLLLYNCISNGGRDFLPERDRAVLQRLQHEIAWHVIEDLQEGKEGGK
jgi:hypothetical protein